MFSVHLLDGDVLDLKSEDLENVVDSLKSNRRILHGIPIDVILDILAELGKKLIRDKRLIKQDGMGYIHIWLKRGNLERICDLSLGNRKYLDSFVESHGGVITVKPRGIVCHWVASNVPTLAFFTVAHAILTKNASIVKVPNEAVESITDLLRLLEEIEVVKDGETYRGMDVLRSVSLISFNGRNRVASRMFSKIADCRVIYGGSEAIQEISALPHKDHCDTLVYGPKYSFAVFDKDFLNGDSLGVAIEGLVKDVSIFNQMACSSPQVLFVERGEKPLNDVVKAIAEKFDRLPANLRHQQTDVSVLTAITNIRARYLLSENMETRFPEDLGWTLLIDNDVKLEDPVHGKCLFVKEVDSIDEVLDLITRRVQTVSVGIVDADKKRTFAHELTYRGVDRVVSPGKAHDYDQPWDGMLALSRMVRWVVLKE